MRLASPPIALFAAMLAFCATGVAQQDGLSNLQNLVDNTRALRSLIQSDPHRPIYHFVAPEGHAMPFDPNGALYWKGKYHLGYIYQKTINGKQRHVWGHVVSTDLLHWTIYPDMLDVKEGDIEEGIFSGGAFLSKDGVPHIVYYGLGASANLMAYATDDDLKVWKKLGRPILKTTDPSDPGKWSCCISPKGKYSVFDPDVWYDEKSDYYYQISGGMKPGLFRSRDMYEWEYLGNPISTKDTMRLPFEDLSCPDFFTVGDKSMLIFISHTRGAQYYLGKFANSRFTPEQHGRMNWPGGTFFAVEQLKDASGRNIIWGWVYDPRVYDPKPAQLKDYGWSGIMSMPRVVSLNDVGELQINPPDEIKRIELNELREGDIALQPNQETTLQTSGKSIELKVEIAGGTHSPFGVKVFASPDGQEETVIRYDPEHEQLIIDFVRSSINGPVSFSYAGAQTTEVLKPVLEHASEQKAPLKLREGETLKLDIFLDRSIIEVFANGRQAITQMVYPELEASTGVMVFSGNDAVAVRSIQSWKMAETNPY
jgi:beta-fructofuranosidase